jgi:hypothetical protein
MFDYYNYMRKLLIAHQGKSQTQANTNKVYKICISQSFTGLCNQLWSVISGIIISIKEGARVLLIDKFLLNVHTKLYCSIDKILCLPSMNVFLQKYNLEIADGMHIGEGNMTGLKVLVLGWEVIQDPLNNEIKKELFQSIRFTPSIVYPALKFVNESQNNLTNLKKGTINVIHLRIEQDWLDHVSSHRKLRVSPAVVYNEIVDKYIVLIRRHIQTDETTFILTGSSNNKVIDYLRNNHYAFFVFPKITPYREMNAAMDMVIGKQCNNVFIGCGGSSFSDILSHRITGANVQKYLC